MFTCSHVESHTRPLVRRVTTFTCSTLAQIVQQQEQMQELQQTASALQQQVRALLAGQPDGVAFAPSPRSLLATLAAAPASDDASGADECDFEDDADRELLDAMLDQNPPQPLAAGLVPPLLSSRQT